jgi:dTDP-4-dehydrorhamnose 3,5-epimerase
MIEGVKIKKLKLIPDERGKLMEILRRDDDIFKKFGQVYMTTAKPGVAKAWHYHKRQDDNFACISGKMRLALYDARKKSPTYKEVNEFVMSLDDPMLITIPRLVYHGFKCVSAEEAIVINTPTNIYNYKKPDEYRVDPYNNDIPYDWRK